MDTHEETKSARLLRFSELEQGVVYIAIGPDGYEIRGSEDTLSATALISTVSLFDDGLVPEYIGESDIDWDSQDQDRDSNGEQRWVTRDRFSVPTSALFFVAADEFDDDAQPYTLPAAEASVPTFEEDEGPSNRAFRAARYIIEATDPVASLQFDYDQKVKDLARLIEDKTGVGRLEQILLRRGISF